VDYLFTGVKNMHKSLIVLLSVLLIAMCAYAEKAKVDDFGNGRATLQLMPRSNNSLLLDETVVYTTDFADATGWTFTGSSGFPWSVQTGNAHASATFEAGAPYLWVDSDQAGSGNHLIETCLSPAIDTQGTDPFVYLLCDLIYNQMGTDSLTVVYSLDGGTTVLDYIALHEDTEMYPFFLNMSDVAANVASFQVGFRYDDNDAWAWYAGIDNLSIITSDAVMDFQPPTVQVIVAPDIGFCSYEDYEFVALCTDDVAIDQVILEYGIVVDQAFPETFTVEMTAIGNSDEYYAVIPAIFGDDGDTLAYKVLAYDVAGNMASKPAVEGEYYIFQIFSPELMVLFTEVPYEFNDISTTGTIISDGDDLTEYLLFADLGFASFEWYDFNYDEISICSNGWMAFGHETSTSFGVSIPSSNAPNGIFAPCADDMNPAADGSGKIYYQMVDGNLVIQYGSPAAPIYFYSQTFGPVFQVVMDPVDNMFTVNYHTIAGFMDGDVAYTGNHVIGSEGPEGRVGSVFYQGTEYTNPANESSYVVAAFLGQVNGTVTAFEDGSALEGAEVRLLNGETVFRVTTTDVNGEYEFSYIIPGTYNIRATALGRIGVTNSDVVIEGLETTISDFVLEIEPINAVISGIVTDVDAGAPLSGCDVRLVQADVTVTTDGTGAYTFGDYTIGDYTIEYNVGNGLATMHDFVLDIAVVEGQGSIDVDLNQIFSPTNLVVDAAFGAATLMFDAPANHMAPPALMDAISHLSYLVDMHYNHNKAVENIEEVEANLAIYQNIYTNITSELGLDDIADFVGYRVRQDGVILDDIFIGETLSVVDLEDGTIYTFEVAADYGYGNDFLMFSEAVSGRPMYLSYTYSEEEYNWIEIRTNDLGTAIAFTEDDQYSGWIDIMSFRYYEVGYTSMNIANNGFISFTDTTSTVPWVEDPIPSEEAPNGVVAVNWDDMAHDADINPEHTAYYYYDAETNSFIVTWFFIKYATENLLEYQGIFYGDTGEIVFNYKSSSLGWEYATIGVESHDGTYGTAYDQPTAADEMALRFVPPVLVFGSVDGLVTDGDGNGIDDVIISLDYGHVLGRTTDDGTFDLECPIGTYDILFDHPDFYPGIASAVEVAEGIATTVPTVILTAPIASVDPESLEITYDLNDLNADPNHAETATITLSNIGNGPLEFSAAIYLLDNIISSLNPLPVENGGASKIDNVERREVGPVALGLDEVFDVLEIFDLDPITGGSSNISGAMSDAGIISHFSDAPHTITVFDLDGNVVAQNDPPVSVGAIRNEIDYDPTTGMIVTINDGGDCFIMDPSNPSDVDILAEIGTDACAIGYDYDNGIIYWADGITGSGSGAFHLETGTDFGFEMAAGMDYPRSLAYMADDPDGYTIYAGFTDGMGGNEVHRYSPTTGQWGPETITLPASSPAGNLSGLTMTDALRPGYNDLVTFWEDTPDQIIILEGFFDTNGPSSRITLRIDPAEGIVQPDSSIDLEVSVHCSPELRLGVYYAMVRIYGDYIGTIEVPVEITVINTFTGVDESALPVEYALHQNYPNPFNPTTAIRFDLKAAQSVSLVVFNMLGQEVANLVDSRMTAGHHSVNFDASYLSSGIYFYRIETEAFTSMKKMVLVK
jgi:Carboxypeptidase regulatory-like domain/Secretion system C-terminal sorting domain